MPWLLVLALLATGALVATEAAASTPLYTGKPRKLVYSDHLSTPSRLSRLRIVFGAGVVDEGDGVYTITPDHDLSWGVPSDATLEGVAPDEGNRWHAVHYKWLDGKTAWGKPFWTDRWTAMQLTPTGSETWRYIDRRWEKLW